MKHKQEKKRSEAELEKAFINKFSSNINIIILFDEIIRKTTNSSFKFSKT